MCDKYRLKKYQISRPIAGKLVTSTLTVVSIIIIHKCQRYK